MISGSLLAYLTNIKSRWLQQMILLFHYLNMKKVNKQGKKAERKREQDYA